MSYFSIVDSPTFYDGTPLSATNLNILYNNLSIVNGLSNRAGSPFSIHRTLTGVLVNKWLWRGAFQYRTGMQYARLLYYTNATGGWTTRLKIWFNKNTTPVYDQPAVGPGLRTIDIPIDNKGYVDKQVVMVEVKFVPVGGNDANFYQNTSYIFDACTYPVWTQQSYIWPNVPSFTDVTATKLNQLSNCVDWLVERFANVPYIPNVSFRNWQGKNFVWDGKLYYGKINAANGNTLIKGTIEYVGTNVNAKIVIRINGVEYNLGDVGKGVTQIYDFSIPMSTFNMSANTDYLFQIAEVVTNMGEEHKDNPRINIKTLYMGTDTPSTNNSLVVKHPLRESLNYGTVRSSLINLGNLAATIKTRIDNNPIIFDSAQMFRSRFTLDDSQEEYWENEMIFYHRRRANVLWVNGKGVKLCYGPITTKRGADDEKWTYSFQYQEDLTSGDAYETKYFYLDQFEGLALGMEYYITGKDVVYAAEYLA